MDLSSRSISELTDIKKDKPMLLKKKSSKISEIIMEGLEEESPTQVSKFKKLKSL